MYAPGDYSTTIGHGICSPAWFYRFNYEAYSQSLITPSALDCLEIQEELQDNWTGVLKGMHQSLQPLSSYVTIKEQIDTFGVDNVIMELENVAEKKGLNVILKRQGARILHCVDNMIPSVCDTARLVPSSEGISLAFNHQINADTFKASQKIDTFFESLVGSWVNM